MFFSTSLLRYKTFWGNNIKLLYSSIDRSICNFYSSLTKRKMFFLLCLYVLWQSSFPVTPSIIKYLKLWFPKVYYRHYGHTHTLLTQVIWWWELKNAFISKASSVSLSFENLGNLVIPSPSVPFFLSRIRVRNNKEEASPFYWHANGYEPYIPK